MITANAELNANTEPFVSISSSACLPDNLEPRALLGRNRTSTLLRATDHVSGADVVVKMLRQPAWLAERERAVQKKRLCAAIAPFCQDGHPVLAPYSLVEEHSGTVLAVRDFLGGLSLRGRLTRDGDLTVDEALRLAYPLASAIDALAAEGYRHGAIKSENVFLGTDGSVRLTDTGFRSAANDLDIAGVHCRMDSFCAGSDMTALAAMLWEAITGASIHTISTAMAASHSRYGLTAPRVAVFQRAVQNRGTFRSARAFVEALEPASAPVIFEAVWRPAAAAGLLGALATVGGNAISADRAAQHPSTDSHRISASVKAPAIPAPKPTRYLDPLSSDDRRYLAMALRRMGASALNHAEVAEVFHLSAAQSEAVADVLADQRLQIDLMVQAKLSESENRRQNDVDKSDETNQEGTSASTQAIKDRVNTRVYSILNQPQRTLWDAMERQPTVTSEPVF